MSGKKKRTRKACPNCPCFEEAVRTIDGWQGLAYAHGMAGDGIRTFDFCPYCGCLLIDEEIE